MPPSIPVPSGGVLADGDKAGHRTPRLQPPALAQARTKSLAGGQGVCPRGWRSMGQARSRHTGQGVSPALSCAPQQGCCRVAAGSGGVSRSPLSAMSGSERAAEQPQSMPPTLVQSLGQLHGEAKAQGRGAKQGLGEAPSKSPAELGMGGPVWAQQACPPHPGAHRQDAWRLAELLPQFPSWQDPPRNAATAAQGQSKQLSSNESFHSPCFPVLQAGLQGQREQSPHLSPPSPPPGRAKPWMQPRGARAGAAELERSIPGHQWTR